MSENDSHEPVTITDKRRIDPDTGEVREQEPALGGPAPAASAAGEPASESDEVAELKTTLQRVKAEYDNYRKRALRDQQVTADRAKSAVITQLLGVLDDLDRARSHGDLESGPLKSVSDKLVSALEGQGLSGFGEEGDEFDPSLHEAVQHEGEGTHPVVGTVMRRGYRIGDQVVRHALVGVVDTVPEAEADNADATGDQAAESDS
ncbi:MULTISPECIES: nucleotide exchange factor GrpE [unclassified Mycolicibacterium]|uniref:nucleotide exchange factor GrpE n=1 Tax=unclassified Mycolicibacterium TaxID=2636767 RepID=UPI00130AF113|nr:MULTISPECIES: nucleotide exchange factor GrpE [unclassified Mycolicibacterium]MUL82006.1 nucleotide exchange factor GrpE [Mycolicibacterium sp. CBMA 329]MUL87772.1 nucleotide exchange factor GrpE [Mycolicibacterium sp. CBMA 331]MUM01596.1 nucleotide exchange factor GrpE [Mycolicibacterium sp. CBMA 334]MUM27281.1 nucleotide exchange factor GrpE [Mycolicibacterium sp. CBMA 295]MUM38069.1 nucleotide exchange factor GrpE [Mycolicibacterium sp. CBMA 247]